MSVLINRVSAEIVRIINVGKRAVVRILDLAVSPTSKRDRRASARPLIGKDDWLFCENGHRALRARRDIFGGKPLDPADFEPVAGRHPKLGGRVACPICGGRIVSQMTWDGIFAIKGDKQSGD